MLDRSAGVDKRPPFSDSVSTGDEPTGSVGERPDSGVDRDLSRQGDGPGVSGLLRVPGPNSPPGEPTVLARRLSPDPGVSGSPVGLLTELSLAVKVGPITSRTGLSRGRGNRTPGSASGQLGLSLTREPASPEPGPELRPA